MSTTGQLLQRSLKLYRSGFLKAFFMACMLSLIAFIPRLTAFFLEHDYIAEAPLLSATRLWLVLVQISCLILFTAVLWRMQCVATATRESIWDDIKIAIRKIPYIIIAGLLQSLIFAMLLITTLCFYLFLQSQNLIFHTDPITFMFLVIPIVLQSYLTVYIFFLFFFFQPLILTEDKGPIVALKRSASLVWGNWWKTVCVQLSPWIVYALILLVMRNIAHINVHVYYLPTENESLLTIIFHILLFALFIPWIAATQLVQLRDLEASAKNKNR